MSVFMSLSYYFNYCHFVIYFETSKCHTSNFFILSQNCSGYLGSVVFSYEFENSFFLFWLKKNTIKILIGIALNL